MNPWLKLIENITLAIVIRFLEFHGFWLDPDEVWSEPIAQINIKYHPNNTDKFPLVPWTFGGIQMRYEGEPMAQIE